MSRLRMMVALLLRSRWRGTTWRLAMAACAAAALGGGRAAALTLQFDYRYDAAGFFGTAAAPTPARTALEFAARTFTSFSDDLAAIQPLAGNFWQALLLDPATGADATLANLAIPAGTVQIFAAARDLPGSQLAQGSIGRVTGAISGGSAFTNAVLNRGQGDVSLDVGPWGGSIAFDVARDDGTTRQWHFDPNSPPAAEAYDFYTAAVHELAHVLGFGTSSAFLKDVAGGQFIGPAVQQLYQNPAPLAGQHFSATVSSPPFLGVQPRPSLGPFIGRGERKLFTPLDYAAMADLGWSVPSQSLGLPGDVDADYDVDGADFMLWQQSVGAFGAPGDVNGDRTVDAYDGWVLQQYLGSRAYNLEAPPSEAAGVPEPAARMLGVLALAALTAARRPAALRGVAAASPAAAP
ncbi:MAG: hypothetical protein IT424_12085 [Pirellulales bacterium]|nr:hypothetical protein [Pirellulales bacterium]